MDDIKKDKLAKDFIILFDIFINANYNFSFCAIRLDRTVLIGDISKKYHKEYQSLN